MDSPRSVTSEMSEGRRLPASIANASKEELQRKLIEALKALKLRDRKLQQLSTVSEELKAIKDRTEPDETLSEKLAKASEELEVAKQDCKDLAAQVNDLTSEKQGLVEESSAASKALRDHMDSSQAMEEMVASLRSALKSMAEEQEEAFTRIAEEKEQKEILEIALADAQSRIRHVEEGHSRTESKNEEEMAYYRKRVGDLEGDVRASAQEKDGIESQAARLRTELENLKSRCEEEGANFSKSAADWQKRVSELEGLLEETQAKLGEESDGDRELARMAARISELENENSALKAEQQEGEGTVSIAYAQELERSAEKYRKKCDELEAEISASKTVADEALKKVEELEAQAQGIKSENERLTEAERLTCRELSQRLSQIDDFRRLEAQLRSDFCELEQRAQQAEGEVADLEESLATERQTFETERSGWVDQVEELQDHIEELQAEETAEEEEGEDGQEPVPVEGTKKRHEEKIATLKEQLAAAKAECKELTAKLAKAEESLAKTTKQHNEAVAESEGNFTREKAEIRKGHKQELAKLNSDLEKTEGAKASLTEELSRSKLGLERIKEEKDKLAGEFAKLQSDMEKIEEEKAKLSEQVSQITAERDAVEEEGRTAIAELSSRATHFRADATKVPGLEKKVSELLKQLADSKREMERRLATSKEEWLAERTKISKELSFEKSQSSRLEEEAKSKSAQVDELENTLQQIQPQLSEYKNQIEEGALAMEGKNQEITQLAHRVEEQSKELENWKESNDGEKEKMKKVLVELRKRLDRANTQQRKSELEAAELRGKAEAEKQSMAVELDSTRSQSEQAATELKEYKIRAHALLKSKDMELQELKEGADVRSDIAEQLTALEETAEALTVERDELQTQLAEREDSFTRHLDDLTEEFRVQLDGMSAEVLQYKGAAEAASREAEQWKASSLDHQRRANEGHHEAAVSAADTSEVTELQQALEKTSLELDSLRTTSEEVCQAKDEEITRLLHLNSDLKGRLDAASASPRMDHYGRHPKDDFTGDSVMTHTDAFEFENLLNDRGEAASVASNTSVDRGLTWGEGGDSKIFALAQRQAQRDEAILSVEKRNRALEAEVLDLERELKLREEQDAVLKEALRDADRRREQQENMLDQVDMEYLKNTVVKLLETGEAEALLPVLCRLLKLTDEEEKGVRASVKAVREKQAKEAVEAAGASGGLLSGLSNWAWS
ncbi:hypothetical protein BSKO_07778 [Bryopsis sp. KO-2023]|nr:hypothetical protein BSKO_07778 [Bryopsis sp. KO-2023]